MSAVANLPTGQRGRLLALGIALVLLLACWSFIVSPLFDLYAERSDRLNRARLTAQRMERLVAMLPTLEAEAAQSGNGGAGARMLSASSDAVATAALQSTLQDIAAANGASLTTVESLPAAAAGTYRRVGVKIALTAPWPVIVRMLESVSRSPTAMSVDELQVRARPLPTQPQPRQLLDAGFSVTALAGIGTGSGSGTGP